MIFYGPETFFRYNMVFKEKSFLLVSCISFLIAVGLAIAVWDINPWPTDAEVYYMPAAKELPGVHMQFDPAMVARIKRDGFDGLDFEIERIIPVANVPLLLGLKPNEGREQLAGV